MEPITTRAAKIYLDDEGMLRADVREGSEETIVEAKENMLAFEKMAQGKRRPTIVYMPKIKSADRDARAHYAGEEAAKVEKSLALVLDSPVSKIIGNFFLTFNKTAVPVRIFTSLPEALEWSRGFLD